MTEALALPLAPSLDAVIDGIEARGYAVADGLVPFPVVDGLLTAALQAGEEQFGPAAIGREGNATRNPFVRRDEICWIDGKRPETGAFLAWMETFRRALNRRLFLGLFDYECHFARYETGAFYRTHVDAFRGRSSRVLSTVLYLNPGWNDGDGGELVLYAPDRKTALERITPVLGRLVVFLSEEFPHEVLPARRRRQSVAGWFRVNNTTADRLDPPR